MSRDLLQRLMYLFTCENRLDIPFRSASSAIKAIPSRILIIKANEMKCFSALFGKELYMFRIDLLFITWKCVIPVVCVKSGKDV